MLRNQGGRQLFARHLVGELQRATVQLGDMRFAHDEHDVSPYLPLRDEPGHFMSVKLSLVVEPMPTQQHLIPARHHRIRLDGNDGLAPSGVDHPVPGRCQDRWRQPCS
ncbi:hypothetical protein D3C76_1419120 [compost metagenome]